MEDVKRNEEELKEFYRKSIVEVVNDVDNVSRLKFILSVIKSYLKK